MIHKYIITKYNPKWKIDGKYAKNEWTSFYDIGKEFDDGILTQEKYEAVENSYVGFYCDILRLLSFNYVKISEFENHLALTSWCNKQILRGELIKLFIKDCLREKCWGVLRQKCFYISFGYDYYTHLGTGLTFKEVDELARKHDLFCELDT